MRHTREKAPSPREVFVVGWTGMRGVVSLAAALSLPTVLATAVPNRNAATKLKKAAHSTACPGESTRVATTVAIELAASWNPLIKSKTSAMPMIRTASSKTPIS